MNLLDFQVADPSRYLLDGTFEDVFDQVFRNGRHRNVHCRRDLLEGLTLLESCTIRFSHVACGESKGLVHRHGLQRAVGLDESDELITVQSNLLGSQSVDGREAVDFRWSSGGQLGQDPIGHQQVGSDLFAIGRFLSPLQESFEQGLVVGEPSQRLGGFRGLRDDGPEQNRIMGTKQNRLGFWAELEQ